MRIDVSAIQYKPGFVFLVCCGCDTSYIVSVHIQCQTSIYTFSLCRGHSWRVQLAKQETLTPPGHLVSPLVFRGPWMSTVVLYCWCHSDSASVLLYFTFLLNAAVNGFMTFGLSPTCDMQPSRTSLAISSSTKLLLSKADLLMCENIDCGSVLNGIL